MDIQQLVEKHQLTQTEKRILLYMQAHRFELKQYGIRHLAKETYTSAGFIVKMAKRMKLSGYSELVFLITDTDTFSPNSHDLVDIRPYLDAFYKCMNTHRDSMIMILSSGYSQNIANYMSEYLNLHGFRCTANSHLELLREQTHQDDLLIVVSNSGETMRLNELLEQANDSHQDVIAFVGNRNSTIAKNAELVISTDTFKPTSFDQNRPQLFFGLSLIYFELLMSKTLQMLR